ncbi:hypothetical protein PEX1_040250 [Penicillium expansum]|uniref:Uncharacterized protein n=1 Tax=Penicillium expansum TaxID=27334 RepID=A0A0A2IYS1_PENEN|nr:hypothetical protein PEX2_086710 [Penicillium expansum]KGO47656.1 hypothetical protein PEX1_040250 [Penicillium expansum]KGO47942.1 hypothetical protein PEXP_038170 [Penicillium expansum]KGO60489.1 hypothetical protein PEX2_086710 [Penicillium expansum]
MSYPFYVVTATSQRDIRHLYNGMRHETRIPGAHNSTMWLYVRLVSNRMPAKWWGLYNIEAV